MDIKQRYQIFRKIDEKIVFWVESAASLDEASRRARELQKTSPDRYFILDSENERFIDPEKDDEGGT